MDNTILEKKVKFSELKPRQVFLTHSPLYGHVVSKKSNPLRLTLDEGVDMQVHEVLEDAVVFKVYSGVINDRRIRNPKFFKVSKETWEEYANDTCPYCGGRFSIPGNAMRNLESYNPNGSILTHSQCCKVGITLSAKIVYSCKIYTGDKTEDDFGISIKKINKD